MKCSSFKFIFCSPENVFSRLCKFNMGKRLNIMSRGSYQRRVMITVLQHNDDYEWHHEGLRKFAGCKPGKLLKDMIDEKHRHKEATMKSKSRPDYCRKSSRLNEVERDYGIQAIEAAERVEEYEKMETNLVQKYQVHLVIY